MKNLKIKQDGQILNATKYSYHIANDAVAGIECRKNGLPLFFVWIDGSFCMAAAPMGETSYLTSQELSKASMIASDPKGYYLLIESGQKPF